MAKKVPNWMKNVQRLSKTNPLFKRMKSKIKSKQDYIRVAFFEEEW